jgi:hypothetical protein
MEKKMPPPPLHLDLSTLKGAGFKPMMSTIDEYP